jgi:hypothetical protein
LYALHGIELWWVWAIISNSCLCAYAYAHVPPELSAL